MTSLLGTDAVSQAGTCSVSAAAAAAAAAPSAPDKPSTILSRLRVETRREHEAVEQVLDLMGASLTPAVYQWRLKQFYGFYAPLEQALQVRSLILFPGTGAVLAARLEKTALLRQDLRYLGVATDSIPLCGDLPPLSTQAAMLGCLYVLEGATLGGRMISRHIRDSLGITPTQGGRFFEGYGDATGMMWQTMRQLLVTGAPEAHSENSIVTSAMATFARLRGWCE